jgi:CTP:phosphocholine cytidylyltransferase-like protein
MYRVKRAVILAAGTGSRMNPVTLETPKPLIKINGTRIIDTIILGLHKNGITEIYVVAGYMKEKFKILEKEYPGLKLIENPYYAVCNNISSLYMARDYIEDAIILDGDQVIYNTDVLGADFEHSGYNSVWTDSRTTEWLQTIENGFVKSCSRNGGQNGWQLFSISRWNTEDGRKLKNHLEIEFEEKQNRQVYWDDVVFFCYPNDYKLGIWKMDKGDVIELDNISELAALDKTYKRYIEEEDYE